MNSYEKTCAWLFSQLPMYQRQGRAAYKDNLVNTEALDKYFNHPHRNFRSVHIGGTNGKGSVSHMIAAILQKAGYKTGLYSSPHLLDFRERIRVQGELMPKKEVVDWVKQHGKILEEIKPSFFEMTVAMAFDYFSRSGVDVAVIEVGMGGRLDSTNIIVPELSVITNISFDHVEFLGDSLEKIAGEKAGIIKDRVPVLIGEEREETFGVFEAVANRKNAPLYSAPRFFNVPYSALAADGCQYFNVRQGRQIAYPGLKSDLAGIIQRKNLPVVLQAVEILRRRRFAISENAVYEGIALTRELTGLRGRWEIIEKDPWLVMDTAHNEAGFRQILKQLEEVRYENFHMVMGVVNDKDIDHVLRLLPKEGRYYFTRAQIPRSLDPKILAAKAAFYGLTGSIFETVPEALASARSSAGKNDLILVGGSTFVVADAMAKS